jgi:hypothetical protein
MSLTKVTYSMIEGASFNVLDYGADRTGVADSKDAINLAFAAMEAAGGGTIYFPKGTYLITDTVGNQTNPATEISFALVGEVGTVLNCNPAVFANRALNLYYPSITVASVKNMIVNCNTKVCVGIYLRSTAVSKRMEVDGCEVRNCHAINDAGVTDSVFGIIVYSDAFSWVASITNCFVQNVTRAKTGLACQAINARGFETLLIANNSVLNVRHSNIAGDIQDADGIVVFSHQDGLGNYSKSEVTVIGNTVEDAEGRCIKLQTNGSAVVQNNLLLVSSAIRLIDTWYAVDSQVGDSIVSNNTVRLGSTWTGGGFAGIFGVQTPLQANVDYSNEGFFQRFNNNNIEISKFVFTVIAYVFPVSGVTANCHFEAMGNICNWTSTLDTVTQSANYAASHFIYTTEPPSVANTAGQVTWRIANNTVFTYDFISIQGAQANYTNKWYFYIYDNFKPSIGYSRELFRAGASRSYTNTCMIRDNQIAGTVSGGQVTWPLDLSKILDGCDFRSGSTTMTSVPAVYQSSRIYKKSGQWGVQNGVPHFYISLDATTWVDIA